MRISAAIWSLRERPARSLPPSSSPGDLQQSTFQCGGFVLIVFDRSERTGIDTALQLVESVFHSLQLVGGQ